MSTPDEKTREVLRELSAVPELQPDNRFTIDDIRAAYDKVFASWTAPSLKPTSEYWVATKSLGECNRCLIVEPACQTKARNVSESVVFIHGGGWSLGTALGYAPLARWLCSQMGLRVLVPDFPQTPEHPAPAALNALSNFLKWVQAEYKTNVILFGDSAGGNLAAVLSNHPPDAVTITAQALLYPVMDLRPDESYKSREAYGQGSYFLTKAGIVGAAAQYCGPEIAAHSAQASPILETDFSKTPPTWLYIPALDPLYDECMIYAERLRSNGVPLTTVIAKNTIHGCASFCGRIPEAERTLQTLCDSLSGTLSGTNKNA